MHSTPFNVSDDAISVRYLLEPFSPYLADPDVTEICVNRPGQVYGGEKRLMGDARGW